MGSIWLHFLVVPGSSWRCIDKYIIYHFLNDFDKEGEIMCLREGGNKIKPIPR